MEHVAAKEEILETKTWIMSNQVVLIEDWKTYLQNPLACFKTVMFWIHLLGFPIYLGDETSVKELPSDTGEVMEVDLDYRPVRAKVEILLTETFMPGILLDNTAKNWVQFASEHLTTLCYKCGLIGH